ncbi:hypothetical protein H4219_001016 [Mycoemilia scoparia]|uniref:PROP1-like PPR domain-containing protein n=1 Tax=Mycoemilia scoparia TaxID=417184 RepID=A0A9W8A4J7_9FUNG|nr:hypothetical protein H4219_001016 [Mycoemilia scoparia]
MALKNIAAYQDRFIIDNHKTNAIFETSKRSVQANENTKRTYKTKITDKRSNKTWKQGGNTKRGLKPRYKDLKARGEKFILDLQEFKLAANNAWYGYRNLHQELRSKLGIKDFNKILKALRTENMDKNSLTLQRMQYIFTEMLTMGIEPSQESYNELIFVHASLMNMNQARSIIEEMVIKNVPLDLTIYNTVLFGYSKSVSFIDDTREFWNDLKAKFQPDLISYSSIIGAECRVGNMERVKELLDEMGDANIKIDISLRNCVLKGIAHTYGYKMAKKDVGLMKSEGYELDSHSFTILAEQASVENDVEAVISTFVEAIKYDVLPNSATLASICKKSGIGIQKIAGMIKDKVDVKPSIRTYNTLLDLFKRNNQFSGIQDILKHMKAADTKPNIQTYGILIDIHSKAGNVDEALEIYQEMVDGGDIMPDQHIYSNIFEAMARSGDNSQSERLVADMERLGVEANIVVYNSLMTTYMGGGKGKRKPNLHGCKAVMQRIVADPRVTPDIRTYNTLFSAYASNNMAIPGYARQIWKWYSEMRTKYHIQRDGFTYNLAIKAFHKARDWRFAWSVYENAVVVSSANPKVMRECFDGPDMIVSLMELCLSQQQPSRVMQLWYDSRRFGIRPNSEMVVMMLHACSRNGAISAAKANIGDMMAPKILIGLEDDGTLNGGGIDAEAKTTKGSEDNGGSLADPMIRLDLSMASLPSLSSDRSDNSLTNNVAGAEQQQEDKMDFSASKEAVGASILTPQLMMVYFTILIKFGHARDLIPTLRKWIEGVPQAKLNEPIVKYLIDTLKSTDQPEGDIVAQDLLQLVETQFPEAVPLH